MDTILLIIDVVKVIKYFTWYSMVQLKNIFILSVQVLVTHTNLLYVLTFYGNGNKTIMI